MKPGGVSTSTRYYAAWGVGLGLGLRSAAQRLRCLRALETCEVAGTPVELGGVP
jgi:hypothetical protein